MTEQERKKLDEERGASCSRFLDIRRCVNYTGFEIGEILSSFTAALFVCSPQLFPQLSALFILLQRADMFLEFHCCFY